MPPIKGADQEGVFTLRTIADADAIREKAIKSKKLALIGGGLLGLEAGNGLRKPGLEVTVIEFSRDCCRGKWIFPAPPCSRS